MIKPSVKTQISPGPTVTSVKSTADSTIIHYWDIGFWDSGFWNQITNAGLKPLVSTKNMQNITITLS